MKNYIICNYNKVSLNMEPATVERLKRYSPAGCPFKNYNMLDLLIDLLNMYSWKMDRGRQYSIIQFLDITNDIKAVIYKAAFMDLLRGAAV